LSRIARTKLEGSGNIISQIDIHTSVSGIWLLVNDDEYFLPFKEYPWFFNARVAELYHVKLLHVSHLYWPDLDVDLDLTALKKPENYPLIAKGNK